MVIKNKKGWTQVLEVFFAIMLLAGVMIVVLNNSHIEKENKGEKVYKEELSVLKKIQLNNSLRAKVLSENISFISQVVDENIANYLECNLTIENLGDNTFLESNNEIYVSSTIIFNDENSYNPKKLKLFCWEKG